MAGKIMFTIDGVTHSLFDWCKIKEVDYATAYGRYRRHWTPEQILGLAPKPAVKRLSSRVTTEQGETAETDEPTAEHISHPDSVVYAVIDGKVIQLPQTPYWMLGSCQ